VHGTTTDNENNIATGWRAGTLSELGRNQAVKLGDLTKDKKFDAVFCSDLKRAVDSAKLAFGSRFEIIKDKRLRECNFGTMTGSDWKRIEAMMIDYINKQFPNGESYKDVERRMREFLEEMTKKYDKKHVAILAHCAPQLALEVLCNNRNWAQAIKENWRSTGNWKPGWEYKFVCL
jgi:broad specificity phosphatase PhoE